MEDVGILRAAPRFFQTVPCKIGLGVVKYGWPTGLESGRRVLRPVSLMLTQTSTTLLNSLVEAPANQAAWRTFCERYGPAVFRFARRRGLSESDADEVLSETLTAAFEAHRQKRYDRSRGRFRTWLFGIAMNKVRETRRRYGVHRQGIEGLAKSHGDEAIEPRSDEEVDTQFGVDVERTLAWQCLDAVRSRVAPLTYQAFDLYVLKERPAAAVARMLGIGVSAVYVAKSRVLAGARREFEKLRARDEEF